MIEVLTATFVGGIVMTMAVALIRPAVTAADAEQAQTELVHSIDNALYRIQRDIRQSDPNGIFVCSVSTQQTTACTLASSLPAVTSTTYLVILTAHTNGDDLINWDSSGRPAWTGFDVYWLQPDANGSGNGEVLRYCFAQASIQPGTAPVILNADVVNAVASAVSSASAVTVARSVSEIDTVVKVSNDSVAVRLKGTTTDRTGSQPISVQADTYARN
jgi:type II secretory pathway pseudopilin PulG